MTALAPDSNQLRELDDDTRRAWSSYSSRLRDLTGDEYERVERECWAELQTELRRVDRRRRSLTESMI